ncbi:MAG: type II toxin-antitoxin system HicA family toxin [Pyrinomonadaceae bacterium]
MRLPLLSGRQVLTTLERLGFVEVHRKGSHIKMTHPDGRRIVFPYHDEVDRYTLKGALKDAGVDVKEFLKQVK